MVPSCVFSWLHPTRWGASKPFSPANLALAEDSFLIALAVAKQQGARSFELRAALALAKLFQSTGRGVEARGVLAPALEGFALTPEFAEVGEALEIVAAMRPATSVRVDATMPFRMAENP
jgi:hypothetical protein